MSKGPNEVDPRSLHFLIWPILLLIGAAVILNNTGALRYLVGLLG